jgi:hypothetical protein
MSSHASWLSRQSREYTVPSAISAVTAVFDQAALRQHQHAIRLGGQRAPVRDREYRATAGDVLDGQPDDAIRMRVERRGRFVEQQDRRIAQHRARNRHQLPLAGADESQPGIEVDHGSQRL